MNNEVTTDQIVSKATRLQWTGLILITFGILSFTDKELLGDIVTLIGAVLIVGSCI